MVPPGDQPLDSRKDAFTSLVSSYASSLCWYSISHPLYSQLKSDLTGVKVGVLKEGFDGCEDDVSILVKKATKDLKKTGATVEEVSVPLHADGKKESGEIDLQLEF